MRGRMLRVLDGITGMKCWLILGSPSHTGTLLERYGFVVHFFLSFFLTHFLYCSSETLQTCFTSVYNFNTQTCHKQSLMYGQSEVSDRDHYESAPMLLVLNSDKLSDKCPKYNKYNLHQTQLRLANNCLSYIIYLIILICIVGKRLKQITKKNPLFYMIIFSLSVLLARRPKTHIKHTNDLIPSIISPPPTPVLTSR